MSGGSYDYVYLRVEDFARSVLKGLDGDYKDYNASIKNHRIWLCKLIEHVSRAMHAVERTKLND